MLEAHNVGRIFGATVLANKLASADEDRLPPPTAHELREELLRLLRGLGAGSLRAQVCRAIAAIPSRRDEHATTALRGSAHFASLDLGAMLELLSACAEYGRGQSQAEIGAMQQLMLELLDHSHGGAPFPRSLPAPSLSRECISRKLRMKFQFCIFFSTVFFSRRG